MRPLTLSIALLACYSSASPEVDAGSDAEFDGGMDGGAEPDVDCVPLYSSGFCGERIVLQDAAFILGAEDSPSRFVWRPTPDLPPAFQVGELILDECISDTQCE